MNRIKQRLPFFIRRCSGNIGKFFLQCSHPFLKERKLDIRNQSEYPEYNAYILHH